MSMTATGDASARERKMIKKQGRREAQAAKMAAKADDEGAYFWAAARRVPGTHHPGRITNGL